MSSFRLVSARAGAGKTATAEAIVAANPNRSIAIVTYSKRLQLDTSRRLKPYLGCDVFTFHGLAGNLFNTIVRNDSVLRALRRDATVPPWTGELYEIVILDEMQDCTDNLFWLTCGFISVVTHAAHGRAPRIVALGDERQAIYDFKGADERYLGLSSEAMATLSPYPWGYSTLSKSFRLSHENAAFVNDVFLGGDQYIVGSHRGPKPLYLHGGIYDCKGIARHLVPLIHDYGPEHTAILTPSVRQNTRLSWLTNYLSEVHKIPIAVSVAEDIPLDDRVLRGKLCVSTYHQFKGNERDLVIVYGVDDGYFDFIGKGLPDDTCPNTTFVALTRARNQIVIVHDKKRRPMPFIDNAKLHETANIVQLENNGKILERNPPGRLRQLGLNLPKSVSAANLARHAPNEVIDDICAKYLKINQTLSSPPDAPHIDAPSVVLTDAIRHYYEAVSDLNGLAVVAAYEHASLGTLTTLQNAKASVLEALPTTGAQARCLCREACQYEAEMSGYKSRRIQMKGHSFDWLGPYLDAARDRLRAQFSKSDVLEFEAEFSEERFYVANPLGDENKHTRLKGRADIVQYKGEGGMNVSETKKKEGQRWVEKIPTGSVTIWEMKFVAQLSLEHVIQACVYAYLWSKKHGREEAPHIILFNVRDGQKWEIVPRDGVASLRGVVEETMVAKYSNKDTPTTDEFLEKCRDTKAEALKACN